MIIIISFRFLYLDSVRNRSKRSISSTSSNEEHNEEHKAPEAEDDLGSEESGGADMKKELTAADKKHINKKDSDDDEAQYDQKQVEIAEVSTFWRYYQVTKYYYQYFCANLENYIDQLTLWLFNFYFGGHQQ